MQVISDLADIEFAIGRVRRVGNQLIIDSDAASTMSTQILVTPQDARATIKKVLLSGSFWRFLLSLPFAGRGKVTTVWSDHTGAMNADWQSRRDSTGINKPW